ncbi:MAG TPA: putative glycolipid-binding domain-containing protein [Ktedonobacteraceae bacterium]|nr:putative glycolipid-binding domain-containing protein [Ktedonobacteraceae bacterium]
MERQIMWSPWTTPGLEHLHISLQADEINADGLILGVTEQKPFRLHYKIQCDQHWRLRSVHLALLNSPYHSLHLLTDGKGSWTTEGRQDLSALQGCLDIDISDTPFTNTLPIRRLTLATGSSVTLPMVYITIPELSLEVTEQRYTCLESSSSGGRYLFESLENGFAHFTAELPVDEDGLVLHYPELFKRVEWYDVQKDEGHTIEPEA